MEPMYKSQQPPKPQPPPEEEKKEPGMVEKGFERVKDGSKQAYQTVSSTVGSMLKKNEAQERRQARYSISFAGFIDILAVFVQSKDASFCVVNVRVSSHVGSCW